MIPDEHLSALGVRCREKLLTKRIVHLSVVRRVLLELPKPPPGDPDSCPQLDGGKHVPGYVHVDFDPIGASHGEDLSQYAEVLKSPYLFCTGEITKRLFSVPYWALAFACLNLPGAPPYPSDFGLRFHAAFKLYSIFSTYATGSAESCLEKYRPYVAHPPQ